MLLSLRRTHLKQLRDHTPLQIGKWNPRAVGLIFQSGIKRGAPKDRRVIDPGLRGNDQLGAARDFDGFQRRVGETFARRGVIDLDTHAIAPQRVGGIEQGYKKADLVIA